MVPRSAAASRVNLLKMQILGPTPDLMNKRLWNWVPSNLKIKRLPGDSNKHWGSEITFGTHLVKLGNTDYRCTQAVTFRERGSRWQGGSSFCHAWLASWKVVLQSSQNLFTTTWDLPPVSVQLPSLHMLSSYWPAFYSLLWAKFQNTCWWLQNTVSSLWKWKC